MSDKQKPFLDVSTVAASRKALRQLLCAQAALIVSGMALGYFTEQPETVQMALALEDELVPQWRLILGGLAVLAVIVLYVWGAVELWQFKHAGVGKYLGAAFAPLFLVQATPLVSTGLMDFMSTCDGILAGMVLFMCGTIPGLFARANDSLEIDATVAQAAGVSS